MYVEARGQPQDVSGQQLANSAKQAVVGVMEVVVKEIVVLGMNKNWMMRNDSKDQGTDKGKVTDLSFRMGEA